MAPQPKPPSVENPPPPLSDRELERILKRQKRYEQKEAYYNGEMETAALVELNSQEQQMENLGKERTEMNETMKRTENILSGLEKSPLRYVFGKCLGNCVPPCKKKSKNNQNTKKPSDDADDREIKWIQPHREKPQLIAYGNRNMKSSNSNELSSMTGEMRNIAIVQEGVIQSHNGRIDRISQRVDETGVRLNNATGRVHRLLND